jgi:hypothetical protein
MRDAWSRNGTAESNNAPPTRGVPPARRRGLRLADATPVWEPEAVMALLLAHQGGWDEMLFVAVPIVIFGSLLAIANRRASRIERQQPPNGEGSPGDETG